MRDIKPLGLFLLVIGSGFLISYSSAQQDSTADAKLVINPSNNPISHPAGRGFALTCNKAADNTDHFSQMKWTGPQGDLIPGSTASDPIVQVMDQALSLFFNAPTVQHSGQYNCSAWYDNTIKLNTGVQIIFFQDVTWDDCPEMQALVINQDGKIRCRVSANPPASITWLKDGQLLSDRYVVETDGIKVTGIRKDDQGDFSLRAMVQQTGLFHTRIINVKVHEPPEIIELADKYEATEGDEVTLQCRASGFPIPTYSWLDPQQRNLSSMDGFLVEADLGTLKIISMKRDSKGSYTCKAKNPAGEASKTLEVSVLVKPEVKEFNNVTTAEGNSATFECRSSGDPLPELNIRKEGQDRAFDPSDDRVSMRRTTDRNDAVLSLTIQSAIRSDDGLYYCSADSKAGLVERAGHLTVEFAPVLGSTPSVNVKTWSNNVVNVTCIAEAIPNATITWSFKNRRIQDDAVYKIYGRSAHSILEVRPSGSGIYGNYECKAENTYGERFINIELEEARVPGMVRDLKILKTTATTVTFEVIPPNENGGLPLKSYSVKFYEEGDDSVDPTLDGWNEGGPYTQERLKPRAVYRFQVAAINEVGAGEYSDERRVVMPAESAPEPPKFVTPGGNVSTYSDKFQIRWTVPEDNGRKIEFFQLRYFQAEKRNGEWHRTGDPVEKEIRNWENSPQFEMNRLVANTHYKVEVRAKNSIGFSQDATMVFLTAAGAEHGHQSNGYYGDVPSSMGMGAIFGIILAIVIIVLIAVDITCYVRYHWGVVFFLRNRVCAKPESEKAKEAAFEDGKGKGDNFEKKTRSEVDNPAFDKEKQPLKSYNETEKESEASEETPMINSSGAKDAKPHDGADDGKNKSPKGSKSSIAKDSLV